MKEERNRRKYRQRTQGIKGAKLPRINMAFDPDVYEFIRDAAEMDGITMTRVVNEAVREKMDRGEEDPHV